MRNKYNNFQLKVIKGLILKYDHLLYSMGSGLENEYFSLTGDKRSSGALYMVAWRLENDQYTHRGI